MRAVGIIIGGTNMSVGIVNSNGVIEAQLRLDTKPSDGFDLAMDRIVDTVRSLLFKVSITTKEIIGIGVGCTGPVDPSGGTILTDFTLPTWAGRSITTTLENALAMPILLENNVDAAVLGEAFGRRGEPTDNVVLLTFGTGVGGAALVNGEIFRGSGGYHPEIGHILVRRTGPRCYCGRQGCLEMVASGTAIGIAGKRVGLKSSIEVFEAARGGDPKAKQIIDRAVESVARGVWIILHTFLPGQVILGGGVMESHYDLFKPRILEVVSEATMLPSTGVSVVRGKSGNESGIIGAAALILRKARQPKRASR